MTDKRSNQYRCPKCGYHIIAREDNFIVCLSTTCNWKVESKRSDDKDIMTVAKLKDMFQ